MFKVKITPSNSGVPRGMLFTSFSDNPINSIRQDVVDTFASSKRGINYDEQDFTFRMSRKGYWQTKDNSIGSLLAPVININL